MAFFVFYLKLIVAIYILVKLIKKTLIDRREKNVSLLFVVSFIVIVDIRNISHDMIPQSTLSELAVLFFLLYFLVRLLGESAKASSLMRNFIDLKTLFDSEIIEKLEEGVALIRSDSLEVLASNSAYQAFFGVGNAFVTLQDVVSALLRGENNFEITDFQNHKLIIRARLINYGKRYALIYLRDVSENEGLLAQSKVYTKELIQNWENSPNLIMLRNFDGKITYVNEAMVTFLHKSRNNLMGKPFSGIYYNEIEYVKHQDIHSKLVREELEVYKGIIKFTYPLHATGYLDCEEQIYTFEGVRQILTTATDVTNKYFLELFQSSFNLIHVKQHGIHMATYTVADLIHFDVLFKERLSTMLQHQITSLGMFLSGLDDEDQQYFNDMIYEKRPFHQKSINYLNQHVFYVEQCIFSSNNDLIGISLKYLNPVVMSFNQPTIGSMIINHIKEGILIVNKEGIIEYSNEMILRILNYERDELIGKPIINISLGLTEDILFRNMDLIKQHNSLHFERIYLTKEGIRVPTEVVAMNLEHENSDMMLLLVRDISEKFIYKKRLIDSQSRYALIFESLQDGVLEIRLPDKNVSIYREFDSEKGLIGLEITFLQWLNSIHDQDRSIVYEAIDIITSENSQNYTFEYRYFRNSSWEWYRATGKYILSEEVASIVIINQNISEIKSVTQKLEESRLILTESERIANMAHWKFQVTKNIFYVSKTFGNIFLNKEDINEIYFESLLESIYPVDLPFFEFKFDRFIWNGENLDIVIRLHNHGKISFVNLIGQVYYDDENLPVYAIGSIADITEKMLVKQRFEESRTLLEHVVEQTPMGIIVIHNNGSIEKINTMAVKLLDIDTLSLFTIKNLKDFIAEHFDIFDPPSFERVLNATVLNLKEEAIITRGDTKLRLISNYMVDADQHYLGKILNIVEIQ